ncbi:glycoside hydrolase family 99-like domain-containing protein [Chitinophagaceae bacterium LWZ2-11]
MKNILLVLGVFVAAGLFFACKKNDQGPSVTDNILDYKIEEIPVTSDYVVGAFYNYYANFNANVTEVPVIGKYNMPGGVVAPAVMQAHIADAGRAGLDYFVFSYRSPSLDLNNYKIDSTVIRSFLTQDSTVNMKFALQYSFNPSTYGISTTSPLENNATKLEQFFQDIIRVQYLFANKNYIKVNGKILLYLFNAATLYSNNNPAIYATLRSRLSALGFDLYIVGYQERWSPPARYPFRFQNCVDAIYHQSYIPNTWDRFYLLPQTMDQNWEYSRSYFKTNYNVSYVPNIFPAYNWKIANPTSTNPNVSRTDTGAMYRQLCNVAKMNADQSTRLILIDNFNDWQEDMQLEPAVSYGDLYLNITKQEFKKN